MEVVPRAIERKVVTALFCDVVGSTELGERLDPEDIDRLLGTYHRLARARIEANGGTVEKFIGDAVVGVFGAPSVHEDDAARAIQAALAIIRDLQASNLGLQVRIGIQTGEAVVRVGADRTAEEGLATGDILNTAARLQTAAAPGGIAVGDPTYRVTERDFDWEDLGAIALKGKAEPVQVWRPLRPAQGVASAAHEATPFVGRDRELMVLVEAFHRAMARPGVELATVLAEPGMGKSRLIRELGRHVLVDDRVTWLKGRCLPYGDGVSFWALGEIVKARAGILESDNGRTIATKLDQAVVAEDAAQRTWIRDRLAPLVGLSTEGAPPSEEESFAAWTRFLTSLASEGPAVVVIEDLHWADASLVSFLVHLADATDAVPLLLVVSARPEVADRHPDWLARTHRSATVQLVSLDEVAIRSLVHAALDGAPDALVAAVLERAAGSPLYAEQLVALIKERGLSTDDATLDVTAIPPTIQALLAARIDALPLELKPALLDASVIGRVFWSGAVASLESQQSPQVAATLELLARRQLTRAQMPSTMEGEAEYGFWHALLRDVAYSFLPRAARLVKHRAAAAWITERAGGRLGDLAEIVADHLERALELTTATGAEADLPGIRSDLASALLAAAEHAMRIEPARAVGQLRRAIQLLDEGDGRWADAHVALGEALRARNEPAQAARAFEVALAAFRAAGQDLRAAEMALVLARSLINSGEAERALTVVDAARPVLEAERGRGLVDLHLMDASILANRGDRAAAVAAATAAIDLARSLGLAPPHQAFTLRANVNAGTAEAEAELREGVRLAIAAGDNRRAVVSLSDFAGELDDMAAALELFDEALELARRYGIADHPLRARRTEVLTVAGRWDDLLAEAERLLPDAVARRDAYSVFMIRMARAGVELARGQVPQGIDELADLGRAAGFRPDVGFTDVAFAALALGDRAAARATTIAALDALGEREYLVGASDYVQVALALGDLELARRVLAKSAPSIADGGTGRLTDVAMGLVREAEGDPEAGLRLFERAAAFYEANGWQQLLADALFGVGRCRLALGDAPGGLAALGQAREIAIDLKAKPMLAKIDAAISAAHVRPGPEGELAPTVESD